MHPGILQGALTRKGVPGGIAKRASPRGELRYTPVAHTYTRSHTQGSLAGDAYSFGPVFLFFSRAAFLHSQHRDLTSHVRRIH